jgi:hypothetical protein
VVSSFGHRTSNQALKMTRISPVSKFPQRSTAGPLA